MCWFVLTLWLIHTEMLLVHLPPELEDRLDRLVVDIPEQSARQALEAALEACHVAPSDAALWCLTRTNGELLRDAELLAPPRELRLFRKADGRALSALVIRKQATLSAPPRPETLQESVASSLGARCCFIRVVPCFRLNLHTRFSCSGRGARACGQRGEGAG